MDKIVKEALKVITDSNEGDPIALWNSEIECGEFMAALIKLHGCKTVVELGVFKGLTSVILANAAEKYTGIDITDYRPEGIKEIFKKLKAKFILGDSATEVSKMKDKSIDFAFIDSFHEFNHVMREWKAIEPKMKKGGLVAFHDSLHIVDVARMVGYIKSFRNNFEVVTFNTTDPTVNRGLTVVKCLL